MIEEVFITVRIRHVDHLWYVNANRWDPADLFSALQGGKVAYDGSRASDLKVRLLLDTAPIDAEARFTEMPKEEAPEIPLDELSPEEWKALGEIIENPPVVPMWVRKAVRGEE